MRRGWIAWRAVIIMDGHLTAFDSNRRKEGGGLSVTPLHQIIHCCLRTAWHPCIKNMLHGYVNQLKPPPPPTPIYNLYFCCCCFSNFKLPVRKLRLPVVLIA